MKIQASVGLLVQSVSVFSRRITIAKVPQLCTNLDLGL